MTIIVGMGPGDADSVPASSLRVAQSAGALVVGSIPADIVALVDRPHAVLTDPAAVPSGATVIALDVEAAALARRFPSAETVPARQVLRARAIGAAVGELAAVGAHLRTECPWDREQTAITIVPHTIEEAFEVAEAVTAGDVPRQVDEVGDLLFQAVFLAQLLEETADADLGTIATQHTRKLISRHPHVYGEAVAESAGGVRDLWERQKREARGGGIFHELPAGLPALAYATKAQRRAASVGFTFVDAAGAIDKLVEEVGELAVAPDGDELGDVLFAAVAVARSLKTDPEIALRAAAQRFRTRVEGAARIAAAEGLAFEELPPEDQLAFYRRAKSGG